jgi:hypothetical protein
LLFQPREIQGISPRSHATITNWLYQNIRLPVPSTIVQLAAQSDRNPIKSATKMPTRPTRAAADTPRAAAVGAAPALDEEEDKLAVAELVEPGDLADAGSVVDGFPMYEEPVDLWPLVEAKDPLPVAMESSAAERLSEKDWRGVGSPETFRADAVWPAPTASMKDVSASTTAAWIGCLGLRRVKGLRGRFRVHWYYLSSMG